MHKSVGGGDFGALWCAFGVAASAWRNAWRVGYVSRKLRGGGGITAAVGGRRTREMLAATARDWGEFPDRGRWRDCRFVSIGGVTVFVDSIWVVLYICHTHARAT